MCPSPCVSPSTTSTTCSSTFNPLLRWATHVGWGQNWYTMKHIWSLYKCTYLVFFKLWTQWMLSYWQPTLLFCLAQTWDAVDVFLIFSNISPCCQHLYLTRLFESIANQHQIMNPHQPWILRIWSIRPQELGYEPTLSGLSSLNGDMVASSCRRTLTTLIQVCLGSVGHFGLERGCHDGLDSQSGHGGQWFWKS